MRLALFTIAAVLGSVQGCRGGRTCGVQAQVEVDDRVANVVHVRWTTESPGTSWVEYGLDGRLDYSAEAGGAESTRHAAHLLGLPALTEVTWRAVTVTEEGQCEEEGVALTGNPPAQVPQVEAGTLLPEAMSSEPYVLSVVMGQDVAAVVIFDREGTLLWYELGDPGFISMAARLDRQSNRIRYNVFSDDLTEDQGQIRTVDLAGHLWDTVRTPMAHHAFAVHPDGTLAWIAVDQRRWYDPEEGQDVSVAGDAVWVQRPGEEPYRLFTSWDWREPEKSGSWYVSFYADAYDWTHANSLNWDPTLDTYLVSMANLDTILELDAATGQEVRSFGGTGGYAPADLWEQCPRPHEAYWTDAGTLLCMCIDGSQVLPGEYRVDDSLGEMDRIWTWDEGDPHTALAQGQALRLANGNTLLSLGTTGLLREVTPDGRVVWEASAPIGSWFGLVELLDTWPGRTSL